MTFALAIRFLGLALGLAVIVGFILLLAGVTNATAHQAPSGWEYPTDCCNGGDCAPIVVKVTPMGFFIIRTGELILFNSPKLRVSGDSEYHSCSWTNKEGEHTRCLYVPPGGV